MKNDKVGIAKGMEREVRVICCREGMRRRGRIRME